MGAADQREHNGFQGHAPPSKVNRVPMEDEAREIIQDFFKLRRLEAKQDTAEKTMGEQ